MFAHLVSPRTSRTCLRAYKIRRISSTGSGSVEPSRSELASHQDGESYENVFNGKMDAEPEVEKSLEYPAWLDTHGIKFKDAKKPQNWLPPSLMPDAPDYAEGVEFVFLCDRFRSAPDPPCSHFP
jgi:hypothetical protein